MGLQQHTHIQLSRAHLTFEMLRLLMLQKDCAESGLSIKVCSPFSSSNSRSQYQHHGLSTLSESDGSCQRATPRHTERFSTHKDLRPLFLAHRVELKLMTEQVVRRDEAKVVKA